MSFPKYPEIVLLPRRPEIFSVKEVIATEKLHGSSARIHFPCGMTSLDEVRFGSHDTEYPSPSFPLGSFVRKFQSNPDLLNRMWETIKSYGFSEATVFGEAYGPGIKAKGIKYTNGQEVLFRAFGIMVVENFVTWDLFVELTDKMGLPRVHEVYRGPPTMEAFDALLEKPSTEATLNGIVDPNNIAEGVVIQSQPLLRNVFGEWLIAKHKAKKFSEKAEAKEVKGPRVETPTDRFAATYVTPGRIDNAVCRLHDRGTPLEGSMKDMPKLLDEIVADLHKECEDEFKGLGVDDKQLRNAVSRLLGPMYRTLLEKGD